MPRNPNKIDYSGGLPKRFEAFQVIEDPRTGGNTRHHFGEILFMVVSAMLCGMNGFSEIEHFCQKQVEWLKKWIKLPHGIPRAQTFSNLFQIIDPDEFKECLIAHIGTLQPVLRDQIIALDGKRLRGSNSLKGGEAVHAVSAWAAESRITLAQEFVAEKSNEIEAIPRLLELLDLERWPQLASLTIVETDTIERATGKRRKREKRYYISSREDDAEKFQQAIRAHWGIENPCHWVLDTSFREDHNKTHAANAAKNLGTTRRIVLNILNDDPGIIKTIPKKRFEALMNTAYRERLLSLT